MKAVPHGLEGWWRSSEFNAGQDFHLCAYADLLLVVSVSPFVVLGLELVRYFNVFSCLCGLGYWVEVDIWNDVDVGIP